MADSRRQSPRSGRSLTKTGVPALAPSTEVVETFGTSGQPASPAGSETGRTHQIRIHLRRDRAHRSWASFRGVWPQETAAISPIHFPRQALPAQALGFVHPITGQALRIEAPLPTDLKDLIAGLRERFGSER